MDYVMIYDALDKIIDKDFSGAISVSKDGETVFEKAYGYADLSNKVKNEVITKLQS